METAWTLKDRHPLACRSDTEAKRGRFSLKGATVDQDERLVSGIIAADVLDIEDEAIVPAGLRFGKGEYFIGTSRAVYLDHSWADTKSAAYDRLPIGTCRNLTHKGDGLYATTTITKRAIGDELLILIEEEALRGLSIGCIGEDEGPPTQAETKRYGSKCRNVIRTARMLEYSLVSMPANPAAVIKCLNDHRIRRTTASIFCPDEVSPSRKSFPVSGLANCGKRIMLDANMDIMAILG